VQSKPWDQLPLPQQVAELRRDFDEFAKIERENVLARLDRHNALEKRVAELEEALKQIQSRLDRLERKNQT
jgi:hypothetical protein